MTNPPKPITERLDDIETKMDELIKISTMQHIEIDLDSIKRDLLNQVNLSIKDISVLPLEWFTIIDYCNKNDVKIDTVFEIVKVLNNDFEYVERNECSG